MGNGVHMRVLSEQELVLLQLQLNLSPRQAELARLISQGMSDKQIADQLGISFGTVRAHISRLFQKCHVKNRIQLLLHIYGRLQRPETHPPQPR